MIDNLASRTHYPRDQAGHRERTADLVHLLMWLDAGAPADLAVRETRFRPDQVENLVTVGHGDPVSFSRRQLQPLPSWPV